MKKSGLKMWLISNFKSPWMLPGMKSEYRLSWSQRPLSAHCSPRPGLRPFLTFLPLKKNTEADVLGVICQLSLPLKDERFVLSAVWSVRSNRMSCLPQDPQMWSLSLTSGPPSSTP